MREIMEIIMEWAYPTIGVIMVILACTLPRLRGRPFLLGYLIINLIVMILWRIPGLLLRLDVIDPESLTEIYAKGTLPVNILGLVGFCLFIPYLLVAGAPACCDPAMQSNQDYKRTRPMTISRALFSFNGRMCRSDYWLKGFLILLPIGIVNNILAYGVDNDGARTVAIVIGALSIWPGLALVVKRLHDRGRSGWFYLTVLIPLVQIVFAVWILIEVWFVKGTDGPNRFGEDPLGLIDAQADDGPAEGFPVAPSS